MDNSSPQSHGEKILHSGASNPQQNDISPAQLLNHGKRVACIGNSIQYYNDCPRFLESIARGRIINQDSCFHGGATLKSLLKQGNGMKYKFRSPNALCLSGKYENTKVYASDMGGKIANPQYDIGAQSVQDLLCNNHNPNKKWDFIVMNDHTQSPARQTSRAETIEILLSEYAPMILKCQGVPVFLMTAAYRRDGILNSQDLGTFDEFTSKTYEGYLAFKVALSRVLPSSQTPRIAPVGLAYQRVQIENKELWERLYHYDHFHPSPHGSFLQGFVIYFTMFGCHSDFKNDIDLFVKNDVISNVWDRARLMQPIFDKPLPKPTKEEALYLIDVAERTCIEYS